MAKYAEIWFDYASTLFFINAMCYCENSGMLLRNDLVTRLHIESRKLSTGTDRVRGKKRYKEKT